MTTENYLLNSAAVRSFLGEISDMTLWRWQRNPEMQFPNPITIGLRRFWKKDDLLSWVERRSANN